MLSTDVDVDEAGEAVRLFNLRFGEMEKVLWCLSRASRVELLANAEPKVLPELIWKIRNWMGLKSVDAELKQIASEAVCEMDWTADLFDDRAFDQTAEKFSTERVHRLTGRIIELGADRNEFSLSSMILHWLTPSRVAVYDRTLRPALEIPTSYKYERAYAKTVAWEFEAARKLSALAPNWIGPIGPPSILHALDKYLWWKAGGAERQRVNLDDPWEVVRRLNIDARSFEGR